MPARLEMLYEGKAKKVFRTDDPEQYLVEFKDDATAFNGKKKGTILDKGFYNAQISAHLFRYLEDRGIPTHLVGMSGRREMQVRPLAIIPVEVVARNIVAGSLSERLGLPEGTDLKKPVLEFYYKSDALGDPMINEFHVDALELATPEEMAEVKRLAWEINGLLASRLREIGILLVDFKLEFGRYRGKVLLGDEISPDTCRFWDAGTRMKLDKDRFRRDLGGVEEAYQEIYKRLGLG